jgi:hypothetical protein
MHLSVIAKEPRAGFVKTRLCPPCTPRQAADVAAAALLDTLDAVDDVVAGLTGVERVLVFDGDPTAWTRPGYRVVPQRGSGLASRLSHAFDDLGPGLIVGMEAPGAVPALADGVSALRSGQDVVGLAVDGGYWVIGLHRVDPVVFDDIPMSTSSTGLAQLSRLHSLQRQVRMLPMSHDLDTIDDLRIAARHAVEGSRLRVAAQALMLQLG